MFQAIILLAALLLSGCSSTGETVHESRFMMGTLVDFTVIGTNKDSAAMAIKAAADEMQRVENLFTIYGEAKNPVKAFNESRPKTPVQIDDEINGLLERSTLLNIASNGAFSVSLGKLNKLWGFSLPDPPDTPPAAKLIRQYAADANHCLEPLGNGRWQRANIDCQLDFGAIAKGYALEQGMKVLKEHGVKNAIINAGGDIRTTGDHDGRPWQIGLRHPRKPDEVVATLKVSGDLSIVTSGDYERSYIFKGRRYHHILDPADGYPAMKCQSATIIADNAAMADGWSTALFVAGAKGIAQAEKLGMEAIVVDQQGRIHTSSHADSRLQLKLSNPMLRTSDSQN